MSKKYEHQKLIDAVTSDIDSKAASIKFNVPASTIRQHRRQTNLNNRAGRPSYLTSIQEDHFVSLLELLPDYGFEITKDVALELAADYFHSLNINIKPGYKWLRCFVNRHTEDIVWKKQQKLERSRANSFTEANRQGWFSTLKAVLVKHNLFDKPSQIFNVDETGFSDKTKGTKPNLSSYLTIACIFR
jgi:hypothetical protein